MNISFHEFKSFFFSQKAACVVLNIIYAFPFMMHTRDPGCLVCVLFFKLNLILVVFFTAILVWI